MDEVRVIIAPRPLRHRYLSTVVVSQPQPHKPRPIRPTRLVSAPTPADAFSKITLDDATIDESEASSEASLSDHSLDSRCNVSQEALEEFLAILRPSVLTAPGRPHRRANPYERPHPYKFRKTASTDDGDPPKKRKVNLARRHTSQNSIHQHVDESIPNDEAECFDWNPIRSNHDEHSQLLASSPPPLRNPPTPPPRPSNPFKSVREEVSIPSLTSPISSASSSLHNGSHCSSEDIEDVVMTCPNDTIP